MMNSNALTFRESARQITQMAMPIAVTRIINSANIFIGMLFIATLGTSGLAAGAIVTSTYTTILLVGMGVLFSASILMGQAMGQKNIASIGSIILHALGVAAVLGIVGGVLMLVLGPLLSTMGQNEEVTQLVQHYFQFAAFGLCPCLGVVVLNQFVITIGKPKFAMLSIFMTVPFNAALGYCLFFGAFGFPTVGMGGIAIAIATNFWLSFLIMLAYVSLNPAFKPYELFKVWAFDYAVIKSIFSLGLPISMQFAIELCAYAGAAMMMGMLSVDALAAQQMVIQSSILAGIIPFSLSQAASILISKQMGQNNLSGVRWIALHGLVLVSIMAAIIAVIYLTCGNWIISLYIDKQAMGQDADVIMFAKLLLSMFAFTQLLDCIRNMLGSSLAGMKHSRMSMIISFIACWVIAVPSAYLAMFYFNFGPIGMPIGFQLGFVVGILMAAIQFNRLTRSKGHSISPLTRDNEAEPTFI